MILVDQLRVKHWIKNLFIFIPLLVSGNLSSPGLLYLTVLVFIQFCLAASLIYTINDIKDVEKDRKNVTKKNRPLASGRLSLNQAYLICIILSILICAGFFLIPTSAGVVISSYIILNVLYSFWLKQISIIDISIISLGFVLRVLSGVYAADLPFSQWLIIMTFTLSMLLALGKRKGEVTLDMHVDDKRKSIKGYGLEFIKSMQIVFATITITVYIMYTVFNESYPGNKEYLVYSSFFVILGISRYFQLSDFKMMVDDPTSILFKDKFILSMVTCWIIYLAAFIYI